MRISELLIEADNEEGSTSKSINKIVGDFKGGYNAAKSLHSQSKAKANRIAAEAKLKAAEESGDSGAIEEAKEALRQAKAAEKVSAAEDKARADRQSAEAKLKQAEKGAESGGKNVLKTAKNAERDIERANKEAQSKNVAAARAEENVKKKAAKEAEVASKTAAAEHKQKSAETIAELKADIDQYVADFFDSFPLNKAGGADAILKKYPTREAAKEAFNAFKGLSDRLDGLRKGMNNSLIAAGKLTREQQRRYEQQAARMTAGTGDIAVPKSLITFVRTESKFFKRLIRVDDDYKLEDEDFKDLLALKMKQTAPERVPDAAQALNMLFAYIAHNFRGHARTIASVGRTLDNEDKASARSARDAALAKTSAEAAADEQAIKATGDKANGADAALNRERKAMKDRTRD